MQRIAMFVIASRVIAPALADPPDGLGVRDLSERSYELRATLAHATDQARSQLAIYWGGRAR